MGTPFILWSIVMYCLIRRAISFACSVWILVILCCIRLPELMKEKTIKINWKKIDYCGISLFMLVCLFVCLFV